MRESPLNTYLRRISFRMIPRKLGIPQFFIDANRINARGKLSEMNLLERWNQDGVISIRMPWDAQLEAERGNNSLRQRKAWSYMAPMPLITTADERRTLSEIERVVFGPVLSDSDARDALIVFTAKKYSAILVTADRALLNAAKILHQRLGVQVMTAKQAVSMIRRQISQRDRMAESDAKREALPLHEWVNNDSR